MISRPFTTFSQIRYSVVRPVPFIELLAKGIPWKSPNAPRMLRKQKSTLNKLTVGTHCQGKHPHISSNLEKLNWCPHVTFNPVFLFSLVWKSTLQATETQTWTPTQSQNLQPTICPDTKYVRTMVAQNFCKKPTNVWFDLRPTPQKGTHAWYF